MTIDEARAIVSPIYEALNQPAKKDIAALLTQTTAVDFVSCSTETECVGRYDVIARFKALGETVPDLTWSIKQLWVFGDTSLFVARRLAHQSNHFLMFNRPARALERCRSTSTKSKKERSRARTTWKTGRPQDGNSRQNVQ
jgi:predicted amino acid dehydrogenase